MAFSYAEKSTSARADRMRHSTARQLNQEIDWQTASSIRRYRSSSPHAILRVSTILHQEWDVKRALEVNVSALALTGLVLGVTVNKKWGCLFRESCCRSASAWDSGLMVGGAIGA